MGISLDVVNVDLRVVRAVDALRVRPERLLGIHIFEHQGHAVGGGIDRNAGRRSALRQGRGELNRSRLVNIEGSVGIHRDGGSIRRRRRTCELPECHDSRSGRRVVVEFDDEITGSRCGADSKRGCRIIHHRIDLVGPRGRAGNSRIHELQQTGF